MSEKAQAANDPVTEWVTFRLDNEKYGIDVMRVREVLRNTEIAPVPGAPPYVLGIINLRGNVVTVIDTRSRFGLQPKEADDASRIIIIELGDEVVGMTVDSVAEVVDLRSSQIEMTPQVGNDDSAKFIHGVTNTDAGLLILVDLKKLFGEEEAGSA